MRPSTSIESFDGTWSFDDFSAERSRQGIVTDTSTDVVYGRRT
jgi:hypothetical protein